MPKIKAKAAVELLTDFLPCGTRLVGHWNKSFKALLQSHSCKIVTFYLWTTACVQLMRTSSLSVQRRSAAAWGCDRKPGPMKGVGIHSISCLRAPSSRHLGIAWGITGTSEFTQTPARCMKTISQPHDKKSQGQRNVWSLPSAQGYVFNTELWGGECSMDHPSFRESQVSSL